ncbi:hypothetical protein [Schleiferia thermophila]|uniref:hypothetical protein n=1 Tax=Schleiferia thermophila TaxID=884107 RepID=UPI002FDA3B3F
MKIKVQLSALFVIACVFIFKPAGAQSDEKRFSQEKVTEFLQMHTGIPSDMFDRNTFKYHSSASISGQRVSGIYLATRPLEDGKVYEFFLRTDKTLPACPYTAYYLAGCLSSRLAGLNAFTITNDECACKTSNAQNYLMRARDVNNIF